MIATQSRLFLLIGVLGLSASPARAETLPEFQYQGYMRSGIGASRGGADQECFGAPAASAKFRLGNECETYLEATFINNHPAGPSAPNAILSTHLTLAALSSGRHDWEPSSPEASGSDIGRNTGKLTPELTLALAEAYVQALGMLGNAKPWVGKRYYRRQNIDALDYWIVNNVGPGAGVEDIDVGVGHLNLAVTRNTISDHDDAPPQDNPDLRWSDIPLGSAGTLEFLFIYGATGKHGHSTGGSSWEPVTGEQFGVVHKLGDDKVEFNRITAQYGRGIFGGDGPTRANLLDSYGADASHAIKAGDGSTLAARNKSYSFRLVDEALWRVSREYAAFLVVLLQETDFGGYREGDGYATPRKAETMLGTKHVWQYNPTQALVGEYGYVEVGNAFAVDGHYRNAGLHKWTISPQVSAEGFWGRPQLRVFFTYATWNKQAMGKIGGPVYAGSTDGFSTGAQFESWW